MSDSNRGERSKVGLAEQNNSVGDSTTGNTTAQDDRAGADKDSPPPSVEDLTPVETPKGQTHSEVAEQTKQDDLQAQQDMAFWAMLMFFATVATVIISGFALILLKRTLVATANAAGHANTMAIEAQKATAAATKAAEASTGATEAMIEANNVARIAAEDAKHTADKTMNAMIEANKIASASQEASAAASLENAKATSAMVRQNELTEQGMRPWVAIESTVLDSFETSDGGANLWANIRFSIKNTGNHAAKIRLHKNWAISIHSSDKPQPISEETALRVHLPPGVGDIFPCKIQYEIGDTLCVHFEYEWPQGIGRYVHRFIIHSQAGEIQIPRDSDQVIPVPRDIIIPMLMENLME